MKVYPSENFQRCPVRLFVKYTGLLPQTRSCGKLYLRPKLRKTPSIWFCDQPYGKNKAGATVKKLCEMAKVEGKFSNHSLRATSASRMFREEVPEQIIKEITGHRSDCVRVYKRTSNELLEKASASIGGGTKRKVEETEPNVSNVTEKKVKAAETKNEVRGDDAKKNCSSLSAVQIIKNVIRTRMEMHRKTTKKVVNKLAQKILNLKKVKVGKKMRKASANPATRRNERDNRIVIDVNLNVNYTK